MSIAKAGHYHQHLRILIILTSLHPYIHYIFITLHCVALHYITLHYILHTYIHNHPHNHTISYIHIYCRASHTGDAIRAILGSASVGVVHVLCACAQLQSTVSCSCHTAACNHLPTHLFVAFLCLFFFLFILVVVVVAVAVAVGVVVVVVVATQLIFAFLWAPKHRQIL